MGPIVPPAHGPSSWPTRPTRAAALTRSGHKCPSLLLAAGRVPGAFLLGRLRRVGPHPLPLGPPPPPAVSGPKPSVVCGPAPACLPPVGGRPPLFAHLPRRGAALRARLPARLGPRLRGGPPALAHPGRAPPAACPWSRPLSGGACGPRRLVGPCPWAACRALLCRARAGPPPGPFWGRSAPRPGGAAGAAVPAAPLGWPLAPRGGFSCRLWVRCLWSAVGCSWAALLGLRGPALARLRSRRSGPFPSPRRAAAVVAVGFSLAPLPSPPPPLGAPGEREASGLGGSRPRACGAPRCVRLLPLCPINWTIRS